MNIRAIQSTVSDHQSDTVLVFAAEGQGLNPAAASLDAVSGGVIANLLELGDFTGKTGECALLYPGADAPCQRIILTGLGLPEQVTVETVRRAMATAMQRAMAVKASDVACVLVDMAGADTESLAQAQTESALLALYQWDMKSKDSKLSEPASLTFTTGDADISSAQAGIAVGEAIAAGVRLARDLVNQPPNICTAITLAEQARHAGEEVGLRVTVLDETDIAELGMGAFLAVAQGSDTPPRLVIMEHNASRASELDTIVLVGKGIIFDTGGYNLKAAENQGTMKADMGGAAVVIGAMRAIGALNPNLHIVGLAPAVDNMISGRAYRQQEVIVASNGVTIEIGNTDAEGRMLLADALVYASRYNPAAVIDLATLTGSSVIALGRQAASLFSTDDRLRDQLIAAGTTTAERVWPMPLYEEYMDAIKTPVADVKNSAGKYGGVGASALFLKHFVDYPSWAHIDIAGLALKVSEVSYPDYVPGKGATGFGVRLVVEFLRQRDRI